jgi:Mrp family chromosome partitioning ATPase
MTKPIPAQVEQMEIIGPDYALAYSALARRVAAVDALMRSGAVSNAITHKITEEIKEAMLVIKQVETPIAVLTAP